MNLYFAVSRLSANVPYSLFTCMPASQGNGFERAGIL